MKDESSIFDVEPENLDKLVFQILGEPEAREDSSTAATVDGVLEQPGGQIGRYKLLSVLGEGGMGIVYLAEQKQPIRRQVAVKVIKPGMDSARVVSRFEAERQTLALLDHPNIAHVHDAGTTELGRPYFVMEYVKGLPITDYCDHHKLSIDDRLILFRQICDAVQHAHLKGIIHRDIKPSNILVSAEQDKAIPKIIDFGVAKALGKPLTEGTLLTEDSQLLGTPEYMSPEQADMATDDIDTRSDVYSLGVLLYVLLTGVMPFDPETLRKGGIEHIRRMIREEEPKTPSTRLTSLGDEAKKIAEGRRTKVATLARCLHKELEWIPLKAMRKERSERYRSASELADDIENYLKGTPLIAGPPTTLYRFKKLVRRNAVLSTTVLAVAVTLTLGLAGITAMYFRAERAYVQSRAISDFFTEDVFGSVSDANSHELTVSYLLNAASNKIEGKFEDQPLVEATIRFTLGNTYHAMGKFEPARQLLERAYQIRLQHLGPEHMDTIMAANKICWSYRHQDRCDDALQLWNEQLEIVRKAYGEEHHRVVLFMNNIGSLYTQLGRYKEAETLLEKALEINKRVLGFRYFHVIGNKNLGQNCLEQGRYDEAEQLCLEIIQPEPVLTKVNHRRAVDCIALLGRTYRAQGRYDQAERMFIESLKAEKDMTRTMERLTGLAKVYVYQERFDEAEELFNKAIEMGPHVLPGKGHLTLNAMNGLAVLRTKQGDFDEAESLFKEVWEGRKLKLGDDHPETLQTINDFGVLRREQQQYEGAESLLRQALDGRKRKLGQDHPACFESMHELAVLYREQGLYDKAEPLLLEAVEGRRLKLGDEHPDTLDSCNNLIELYEACGKTEKAGQWRAKLPR